MTVTKEKYKKQIWHILGAGVSGLAAASFLRLRGAEVKLVDSRELASDTKARLTSLGIKFSLEKDYEKEKIDGLVVSPGFPRNHPLITLYVDDGIPICSEIDLALEEHRGLRIGVTGTNGKSTVTALIALGLCRSGKRAVASGNYGLPLTKAIEDQGADTNLVIELSSYQLDWSPNIPLDHVVVTSLSPDHLSWHGTYADYLKAKWNILKNISKGGTVVFSRQAIDEAKKNGLSFDDNRCLVVVDPEESLGLQVWGLNTPHDRLNALMAAHIVAKTSGIPLNEAISHLESFRGLAHRLEVIGLQNSNRIINDSKSTNVAATSTALDAIQTDVVLLLGGRGKGESFRPLVKYSDKLSLVLAFGEAAEQIYADLGSEINLQKFATMEEAVVAGILASKVSNTTLILSPGCASFDEFTNFEERGYEFTRLVGRELAAR